MSQPSSQTTLPSSQPLPPDQPLQCEGSKHTQLHITTDPSSSSLSQSLPTTNNRPESPLNRKRAETKDEDNLYGLEQHHGQDGVSPDNNGDSSLPPLKKSKISLALSQANMTEYRSSQDYIDDQLSPQTSPVLEPISPASPVSSSSNAQLHRRLFLVDATVPPVIPLLTRSSTLEEIKPTTPPSLPNENETAIENLSLGTRGGTVPGRGPGLERAMGVITTSRQGSPALGIVDMATRETTPMLMEEEIVHHPEASQITTDSSDPKDVSSSIDTMDTVEHSYFHESHVELSDNSENEDADYELTADTTVDENFNRVDTSESEDDDSFSDIHIANIASNNYDAESRGRR